MDVLKARKQFENGEQKFYEYLGQYTSAKDADERIGTIFDYLTNENHEVLAFMFKQAAPLVKTMSESIVENSDFTTRSMAILKVFILLIDSLSFSGYINENFFSEELKNKKENLDGVIVQIPREKYNEMVDKQKGYLKKRKSNKKNGKK